MERTLDSVGQWFGILALSILFFMAGFSFTYQSGESIYSYYRVMAMTESFFFWLQGARVDTTLELNNQIEMMNLNLSKFDQLFTTFGSIFITVFAFLILASTIWISIFPKSK